MKGDFLKYKIDTAVWANKKFTFQFRETDYAMVPEMNVLFLHVVRDSGGNFVTYNWNTRWLTRIKDCTGYAMIYERPEEEKPDAMLGGPFNLNNHDQQSWPLRKKVELQFASFNIWGDTMYNILEPSSPLFGLMYADFSASDCFTLGYVTGVDA